VLQAIYSDKYFQILFYKAVTVRFKISLIYITLSFCSCTAGLYAQFLKDTSSISDIKKSISYIYNFQFEDANKIYNKISQSYPEHPVLYLMKGMITYWENYPLISTSPARASFENDLRNCIGLYEKRYNPDFEAEYLLVNLCARGLLLVFYADNDLNMEVFPLATSTYRYIRRSFNFTSVYSDFFFFTGLYDYYREAYPEVHPVYKPLAILFPKGDKSKGLKELQKATERSILLKAESFSFLSGIFLNFERNYQQATYYKKSLYELYPDNLEYIGEYIENLLLVKQYDEAEKLILSSGSKTGNLYFQAQLNIFNGILLEKKYHDLKQAQEFYTRGARDISLFGDYGHDLESFAYFGLSRISDANGDNHYKKLYRRLANELAEFRKVNFD
jgi:hypothetical protein